MNTANEVNNMADSLSNVNSQLCSCVGLDELMPAQASAEKRINEAYGMKSRSKQANKRLAECIGYATKALARSQVGHELRRQRNHVA